MKIAFFCETLCLRGTSTALYDYAHYNEKILKNESMIMYDSEKISEPDAIEKFEKRFLLFPCKKDNIDTVLEQEHCDILYVIKYGKNDGYLSKKVKKIEGIFPVFKNQWCQCSQYKQPRYEGRETTEKYCSYSLVFNPLFLRSNP